MKKFNGAIVGCGAISTMHGEPMSDSEIINLHAVCDIDEEQAKKAAEKYGCKYYTDYDEMLRDESIEVIHICTPHYLHAPMAIKAMRSGKHVLTEKPMAIKPDDAANMIQVSRETGRTLGVCFQNRYNNTSVFVKELLLSGKAGRVIGARSFVTWARERSYYADSNWRGTWEKEGGGVLINQSIHTLDLLQWFIGDIAGLKANVDTRVLKDVIEVEDTADATILFQNGARAIFYVTNCYVSNAPISIELVCENAVIKLEEDVEVVYQDGHVEKFVAGEALGGTKSYWGVSHKYLIDDFYSSLSKGESFKVDGEQGITTIKIIEAIYESSRSGRFVNF